MAHYFPQTVQECLELKASALHEVAETLSHGDEKESLLERARRMVAASDVIDRWLASPGLRPPR